MSSDICGDANSDTKKVQILMSTYNGEEYIREQIDSILAQSYPDVDIFQETNFPRVTRMISVSPKASAFSLTRS